MRFFVGKYIHSLGNVRNCKKPMLNTHFMGILVVVLYYGMVVGCLMVEILFFKYRNSQS